jgi:hypothetical protein
MPEGEGMETAHELSLSDEKKCTSSLEGLITQPPFSSVGVSFFENNVTSRFQELNLKSEGPLVWSGLLPGPGNTYMCVMSVLRLYNATPWLQSHWCA